MLTQGRGGVTNGVTHAVEHVRAVLEWAIPPPNGRNGHMADDVTPDETPATEVTEVTEAQSEAQSEVAELDVEAVAVTDGAYALFVADFADEDAAWAAYEQLKDVEDETPLQVEGVLVVKRSLSGELEVQKVTDPSTRRGLGWGVVGGVVLGVLFPPSILGSAVVLGAAGAGIGKAREVHHRHELADELADAIDPGHSGLVALVSDPAAVKVQKALDKADRIVQKAVDEVLAADIKAEARAAQGQPEEAEAVEPAEEAAPKPEA